MAINFPSSPSNGDTFTSGGVTWKYVTAKTAWVVSVSGTLAAHTHPVADLSDATANSRSLIQAANYAAMRTLLDLEAGTDFYSIAAANAAFQPLDADLTALAALSTVAAARALLTLTDPSADRVLFWDDSAGAFTYLTMGTNLSITGTTLDASGGGKTLLATLDTASAAAVSVVTGTLDLTGYSELHITLENVGGASDSFSLNIGQSSSDDVAFTATTTAVGNTTDLDGFIKIDLVTGVGLAVYGGPGVTDAIVVTATPFKSPIVNASTTIYFEIVSGGNFDEGQIKIYGGV